MPSFFPLPCPLSCRFLVRKLGKELCAKLRFASRAGAISCTAETDGTRPLCFHFKSVFDKMQGEEVGFILPKLKALLQGVPWPACDGIKCNFVISGDMCVGNDTSRARWADFSVSNRGLSCAQPVIDVGEILSPTSMSRSPGGPGVSLGQQGNGQRAHALHLLFDQLAHRLGLCLRALHDQLIVYLEHQTALQPL